MIFYVSIGRNPVSGSRLVKKIEDVHRRINRLIPTINSVMLKRISGKAEDDMIRPENGM
jgi:hypothetical protein